MNIKMFILAVFNLLAINIYSNEVILTNGNSATLTVAIEQAGINGKIIIKGTISIDENVSIPYFINLVVDRNGYFDIQDSKQLTLDCSLDIGIYKVFSETGIVNGQPKVDEIYPHWWKNESSDWTVAFNRAFQFGANSSIQVTIPPSNYLLNNFISPIFVSDHNVLRIKGNGNAIINANIKSENKASSYTGVLHIRASNNSIINLEGFTINLIHSYNFDGAYTSSVLISDFGNNYPFSTDNELSAKKVVLKNLVLTGAYGLNADIIGQMVIVEDCEMTGSQEGGIRAYGNTININRGIYSYNKRSPEYETDTDVGGYGVVIAGNISFVSNVEANYNTRYGIDIRRAVNALIVGNTIIGNREVGVYGSNRSSNFRIRYARVLNNYISGLGSDNGYSDRAILLNIKSGSLHDIEQIQVSGNVIEYIDYDGIYISNLSGNNINQVNINSNQLKYVARLDNNDDANIAAITIFDELNSVGEIKQVNITNNQIDFYNDFSDNLSAGIQVVSDIYVDTGYPDILNVNISNNIISSNVRHLYFAYYSYGNISIMSNNIYKGLSKNQPPFINDGFSAHVEDNNLTY